MTQNNTNMRTMMREILFGALPALGMVMSVQVEAGSPLKVRTQVTRPENNRTPVTVTVLDEQGDTLMTLSGRRARFAFTLPQPARYIISFHQPFSIEKQVTIDTRKLENRPRRPLDFEVVLEPDPEENLIYGRPVGNLAFEGPRLRVEHQHAEAAPVLEPLDL